MKLHLPRLLAAAVLASLVAVPAYTAEIPDEYKDNTVPVWDADYLADYASNASTDYIAFLLGMDIEVPSDISLSGGNLYFTSRNAQLPVSLDFTGSDSSALKYLESLVFDTLSGLSFTNYKDSAIYTYGNLVIQNVTDGVEDSDNPDVLFTGNTGYYGGAIYAYSGDVSITGNGDVTFTGNTASSCGGAIYAKGDVSISGNGDVTFSGNTASPYFDSFGGAIYADGGVSITGNGDVLFTGNTASSSYFDSFGGAIDASGEVSITGNGDVTFTGNTASTTTSSSSYYSSYGGAIYAYDGVSISGNGDVLFTGNSATFSSRSYGGAIYADGGVSITGNGDVTFTGNTASTTTSSSSYSYSYGGAIYAGSVSITGNGDVYFTGNTASSYCSDYLYDDSASSYGGAIYARNGVSITGNGDVSFAGNSASSSSYFFYSYGGAICADGDVSISGNGDVTFTGNTASSYGSGYLYDDSVRSSGGAIYASEEVSITGNGDVLFTGNSASSSYDSRGGAIYAYSGGVSISGNETVCFEKNYERNSSTSTSTYRLRSIYTTGDLNLSAKTGGHITFHDSVYGGTTALNADYTDAEGVTQQAKGAIIFSGQYTKDHLDAILEENNEGRVATDSEILDSRTTTLGATTLYGGTLQVVDGAILDTARLSVAAGSSASVLLRDAGLNGAISFGAGSSLELQGSNTTTGSLTMGNAVTLTVTLDNSHLETAALTLTGSVSTGTLSLNLNVDEEHARGMYRILSAGSLATEAAWTAEKVSVQGGGGAAGATFGDLLWQDGTLYYAASPVWSNYAGTMVWSSTDTNWNNGSAFRAGQEVIFMDRGAGEVQLVGELAPVSIHVQNTAGNDYAFTGSGKLGGNTTLTKTGTGELTIATANDYTGRTELQEGTLNVHHSTALGATATGEASLTTAAGTTLKVANASHLVLAGDYDLAGNVDVAAGSTLELQKDGRAAGTLSGSGTVQATDSQVTVGKIIGFTGNLQVEGKGSGLSIEAGSYTGTGTLSVAGGTLTFGAKGNITLNAGGQLVLQSWDDAVAGVTANNITVSAGATLAAKAGVAALGDMPEISNHGLSVALSCSRLTLDAGATLDAEGACFDLNNGMLTLAVTPDSAEKIELVLAGNAVYTGSEQVVLFLNVKKAVFTYGGSETTSGSLKMLDAADYFTGAGINEATQLVYDQGSGTVYLQGVVTIPEPATATLSLLALAGLCARRRRK